MGEGVALRGLRPRSTRPSILGLAELRKLCLYQSGHGHAPRPPKKWSPASHRDSGSAEGTREGKRSPANLPLPYLEFPYREVRAA